MSVALRKDNFRDPPLTTTQATYIVSQGFLGPIYCGAFLRPSAPVLTPSLSSAPLQEADAQLMQLLRQVLENQLRAGAPMDPNYVPSYASSMSEETQQGLFRSLSDPPAHQSRKQRHFEQAPASDLLNTSQVWRSGRKGQL